MAVYDSEKTRETARTMDRLINALNMDVRHNVGMALQYEDDFEGQAADAMVESLQSVDRLLGRLSDDLETIKNKLYRYADTLDLLDEEIAEKVMGGTK